MGYCAMNVFKGFQQISSEIPYIIEGAKVTLEYALIAMFFGFCGGTLLAIIRQSKYKILRALGALYLSVFRGTPLLLQLSIIYFAIPQIIHRPIPAFVAGIIAFSLNSSAYVSEIMRAGMQSVSIGQIEIGKVLGCSKFQIIRDIVLPQGIRNVLPSLVNEMIDLLKESAIVSIIGESDLLRRANVVSSEHYLYLEPLLIAGLCYYCMIMILSSIAKCIERKLSCSR
ncbi:MAG: amino acid ABC transporter permease [Puniceicoccales bacterium]|jgi:His/Glu/Gln/Arg/opine family amino acid ABC transporter permease subunit|nr:amino acid ABC transporter permease [Puniceicoccales bacterium]